jgi:hypothetical protein
MPLIVSVNPPLPRRREAGSKELMRTGQERADLIAWPRNATKPGKGGLRGERLNPQRRRSPLPRTGSEVHGPSTQRST